MCRPSLQVARGKDMKPQFDVSNAGEMKKVVIRGKYHGEKTFPSLNNLLNEYGRMPVLGNKMKRKHQEVCSWEIRRQLKRYETQYPLIVHYRYFEPSKGQKRDYPNIHALTSKIFLDALQDCNVIPNDGPMWVLNETHDFFYTDEEPYIEIYLEEITGK